MGPTVARPIGWGAGIIARVWPVGQSAQACDLPGSTSYGDTAADRPDWCEPLDAPVWVEPAQASLMRDDDPVLGFEAAGRRWAIPWWVMKNHHVANLTLEGEAFLVTLCEACVAGGVFDPVREGQRMRFQTTGWYQGSPLMTDEATGSLWALINGTPLAGPAASWARLPMRPTVHATWAQWRTMYPDTLVVHGEGEPRDGHGAEMPSPDHTMALPVSDTRLAPDELLVGVEADQGKRAYPLAALHAEGGIAEDVLGDRPIVVAALPGAWLAVSFDRRLEGRLVELQWDGGEGGPPELIDLTNGSRFDLWGTCVAGADAGKRLDYVRSSLKKWQAWVASAPEPELWSAGGVDRPG